jgi:cytoskeletal protein RodZ
MNSCYFWNILSKKFLKKTKKKKKKKKKKKPLFQGQTLFFLTGSIFFFYINIRSFIFYNEKETCKKEYI